MVELTSMKKLRWEQKKKELQEKAVKKAKEVSDWMKKNKETIAVAAPVVAIGAKGAISAVKPLIRNHTVSKDIRDRKTRFYDHSLGCYWYTKRPLRSDELRSVQRRKSAGESYGDIFKSMHLLK